MKWYLDVLKKYVAFQGRARRTEYWMFTLVNILIVVVLSVIERLIHLQGILSSLYLLAVLLPTLGVSVRRLHDTDRTGWWLLIGLIPVIGSIILLIFMVLDSQPGQNQYGPNPKAA